MDRQKYSGTEIQENYQYLINKWGEWEFAGDGTASIVIRYVNISNALFSGLMMTFCSLSIASLLIAVVCGKIIFPALKKHFTGSNDEMVDLATLKSAQQIDDISKSKKEWF